MKHILRFAIILLVFSSCNYPCAPSDGLQIELVGFTQQEADTIMLKKYEKGKGFTTPVDSLLIDENVTRFRLTNDTLKITSTISTTNMLSKFDYLIRIPSTNSMFYISEMNEPQQEGRKSTNKIMCVNAIQSCKLNGVFIPTFSDIIYLKK